MLLKPPDEGAAHPESLMPAAEEIPYGPKRDLLAVKHMITSSWLNVLLICAPLGVASDLLGWGAVPTFVLVRAALWRRALLGGGGHA